LASFLEILSEDLHGEIDGAAMSITDKALEGVFPYVEGKAGSAVVVKRAERLVTDDFQSQLLGDSLDGEVAKLL
jgi:hypothetical protein